MMMAKGNEKLPRNKMQPNGARPYLANLFKNHNAHSIVATTPPPMQRSNANQVKTVLIPYEY